ncbi:MAG: hypothetical protein CM15mP129_10720 [Chloroflexota bacterium]|nr:MAG: hypothetical protein CM15mP129_10720 [Chloroflexota bacterium]
MENNSLSRESKLEDKSINGDLQLMLIQKLYLKANEDVVKLISQKRMNQNGC